MDKGGKKKDYFFSSYLKKGGRSYADMHKNILAMGGGQGEALGDDLDNFLFDDSLGNAPSVPGTHSTEDITPSGAEISGVFGGDTYIARYGVAEAYSPLDDQTLATPQSSIHSYIVESSDNIAFRHAESDDSLYYPGSIAKDVLTEHHQILDSYLQ